MTISWPSRKIRVAVLKCFEIPERIAKSRGQFDNIFNDWLQASVAAWNEGQPAQRHVSIEIQGWDVVKGQDYPDSDTIDAVIITGSTASAYDNQPWIKRLEEYLKDIYNNRPQVRIFGGCFGHQIVAQTLLGQYEVRVGKNPKGWEIGVCDVEVTPSFASHFPDLLGKQNLSYQLLHADNVFVRDSLPANWVPMGSSSICDVQGLLNPGRVLTYQGHPEFDSWINSESTISLAASGTFSQEELEGHIRNINKKDGASLAGKILIDFFASA